jgi:hypothetical protein
MSKLGGATTFAAEASLWIAGAAIIAGAAGAHWNVKVPDVASLMGATPSPSVAASASPSPTAAIRTLAPGASPTMSPLAAKYQTYVARADYQFKAKYTSSQTLTVAGKPMEIDISGTMGYLNGNHFDHSRVTSDGAVETDDTIALDGFSYESIDSQPWTKTDRPAADLANDRLLFAPVAIFIDGGVETKNGLRLHRLDIADPVAFSKAALKVSTGGATDAQFTYTVWVDDNGVPADIKLDGWVQEPINGVSTKVTTSEEFRIIATSGVSISAPI